MLLWMYAPSDNYQMRVPAKPMKQFLKVKKETSAREGVIKTYGIVVLKQY